MLPTGSACAPGSWSSWPCCPRPRFAATCCVPPGQAGTLLGRGRRVAAPMVDHALERLREQSLLGFSLDGQVVSVHGLVARAVREEAAQRGRLAAAFRAAASTLGPAAEALVKRGDQAAVREMLGQVMALLNNAPAARRGRRGARRDC